MFKRKNEDRSRSKKKRLISIICVALAAIFCVGFVSSLFKDDNTKTISASAFSVGSLDEDGKYVEDNQAIFTEEAFGCLGLRIKPDFKADLTYDIYFYDYNDNLVEAKKGLTDVYDEENVLATHCRVVIHPAIPADEDGKDFSINFLEVRKYAKQLTITVDKEQPYAESGSVNLYREAEAQIGQSLNFSNGVLNIAPDGSCKISGEIEVKDHYEYFDIYVKRTSTNGSIVMAGIVNGDTNAVTTHTTYSLGDIAIGEFCKITLKVPEALDNDFLMIRLPKDAVCCVYGYN